MRPIGISYILPRCHHIFLLEQADGVCCAWQLVLHAFSHLFAVMFLPVVVGSMIITFMVLSFQVTIHEIFWMISFVLMSSSSINAQTIFICSAFQEKAGFFGQVATMLAMLFQGFLVPRNGLPTVIQWVPYLNPAYWAYSGAIQAVLTNKQLECHYSSPLLCANRNFNLLIHQFGLDSANKYTAMLILMASIVIYLSLALFNFSSWKRRIPQFRRKPKISELLQAFFVFDYLFVPFALLP